MAPPLGTTVVVITCPVLPLSLACFTLIDVLHIMGLHAKVIEVFEFLGH